MLHLSTRKRDLLKVWAALFLLLFVAMAANPDAMAESEGIEHRSRLTLFGGVTQDGSDTGASFGLEYEYRIRQLWGIGGLAEYAGGDFDSWVIGVPVFIHPYAGWFVTLVPGVEFEDSESSFLFRAGMGYDFDLWPRWSLSPEINADFVEGGDTKLVYGLSLSYAF